MEDGSDGDDCDSESEVDDVNQQKFADPTVSKCSKLQIIACHNCDPMTRSVARLSVPFLMQAVLSAASEIIRLALVGHQLGTMSLGAFVIVDLLLRLTGDAVGSILSAGNKMITQVTERDNKHNDNSYKAGRYLQLSILLFAATSIPFIVIWALCMDKVLLFLGYDSVTAEMGRQFAIPYSIGSLFAGVCSGFRMMLDVVGYEVQSTYLTAIEEVVVTVILAVFLCWQSLFPNASLVDVGYVFLISDLLCQLLLIAHALCCASWLGPAEVAAFGLLGSVWDAVEMIIAAIGEGAEVRSANLLGSGKSKKAEYLAYKSFWIGIVSAAFMSLLLMLLMNEIPSLLTPDALLQGLLRDLIPMISIACFASALAIMSGSMLYAQNRFSVATTVTFLVSLFVTLPLAGLSSIKYGVDLKGQTGAVVIGMSLTAALSTYSVVRSDWKEISDAVVASHNHGTQSNDDSEASESSESILVTYDDWDWTDLPQEIQQAAATLGYDEQTWNNDLPSPLDRSDWDELTVEQQGAAMVLNYTQTKWDNS
ncbi:MAG: hypothetical protein SGILL_002348 [Bacillariaceae sp.]